MSRETQKPDVTEGIGPGNNKERVLTHPAFATARFSRVNGQVNLFDSNVPHNGYVTLTICEAEKKIDAYSEWVFGHGTPIMEVAMSEAQFVGLVSRMNIGSGTPVTIQMQRTGKIEYVPGIDEFESSEEKLARIAGEIGENATVNLKKTGDELLALFQCLPKKKQDEARHLVDYLVSTSTRNMEFGKQVLTEHAEKLTVAAKQEINATVTGICTQLGISSLHQLVKASNEAKALASDS